MRARSAMKMSVLCGSLVCAGLVGAEVARAQQGEVSFAFEGSAIELRVLTGGTAGRAEVVDGIAATVTVRDRAGHGGAALSLSDGVLSLENRSAGRTDYRITVPPGASVSLAVDGRRVLSVASAGGGRRLVWQWSGGGERASSSAPAPPPGAKSVHRGFTVNAYSGELVTDSADVAYPERIRALKIVVGGERFRVSSDRSVSFGYHEPSRWGVITPHVDDASVTVELPSGSGDFKVRFGGVVIWALEDARGRAFCEPVAEVERRDGTRVWVFTPEEGRLECPARGGPQPA